MVVLVVVSNDESGPVATEVKVNGPTSSSTIATVRLESRAAASAARMRPTASAARVPSSRVTDTWFPIGVVIEKPIGAPIGGVKGPVVTVAATGSGAVGVHGSVSTGAVGASTALVPDPPMPVASSMASCRPPMRSTGPAAEKVTASTSPAICSPSGVTPSTCTPIRSVAIVARCIPSSCCCIWLTCVSISVCASIAVFWRSPSVSVGASGSW